MTYRILVVCTGNICRSPMAERLLRDAAEREGLADDVEITSGGVSSEEEGHGIDPRAVRVLEREGIATTGHRAHQVGPQEIAEADLVLALDHDHLDPLRRIGGPGTEERLFLLRDFDPDAGEDHGIRDPWYGGPDGFEETRDLIRAAVPGILDHARTALDPA